MLIRLIGLPLPEGEFPIRGGNRSKKFRRSVWREKKHTLVVEKTTRDGQTNLKEKNVCFGQPKIEISDAELMKALQMSKT